MTLPTAKSLEEAELCSITVSFSIDDGGTYPYPKGQRPLLIRRYRYREPCRRLQRHRVRRRKLTSPVVQMPHVVSVLATPWSCPSQPARNSATNPGHS